MTLSEILSLPDLLLCDRVSIEKMAKLMKEREMINSVIVLSDKRRVKFSLNGELSCELLPVNHFANEARIQENKSNVKIKTKR